MDDRYAAPLVRVLILPKWYPWPDDPVFGVFCREHAKAAAVNHDVVVLAFRPEPMTGARLYRLREDRTEPLRTLRLVYRRPRLRPAAMATQLVGMVAALLHLRRGGWGPDVIHAHVFSAAFPAVLLGQALRRPVVVSEHFTAFQRGLVDGYDRLLPGAAFRGAALVCPVSEDLRRQLEYVEPAARFEVVPNVVDSERFHPPPDARPRPAGEPARLLNVGWLHKKKAQADLVEAVALLRGRGLPVELDIVGEGDERAALEERVRRRGL